MKHDVLNSSTDEYIVLTCSTYTVRTKQNPRRNLPMRMRVKYNKGESRTRGNQIRFTASKPSLNSPYTSKHKQLGFHFSK